MDIFYSRKAERWLLNVPEHIKSRILEKLVFFASQHNPLSFAKYVVTEKGYRFRIGHYRIIFTVEKGSIVVAKIERRDKAYD